MGLFDRWRRQKRSTKARDDFISFADALNANNSHSGVLVTQDTATSLPAVYRCVSLNSDIVATLPVDAMVREDNKRRKVDDPKWLASPNDSQDWVTFLGQVQSSLELDGNAFILKASTPRGVAGLFVLPPVAVTVDRPTDIGKNIYKVQTQDGGETVYPATAILHIMGFSFPGAIRGMSPIAAAKQAIGLGLAAERFGAQYFGTGATLSGVIEVSGSMGVDAGKELLESFRRKHGGISKSHAIGLLTGGAEWKPLSVTPEDSQFLETRRFTDVQIANIYGVPAEFVTEAEGAKGYVTGLYARQYMWMATGINPRLVRLEKAFSTLLPKGQYLKFKRNAFLAMDPKERADYIGKKILSRAAVPNEWRALDDEDPLGDYGDEPLWSVQWGSNPYTKK